MSVSGAPERRLAAILHGDVVGSSRLMAEDEELAIRLTTVYRQEIELLVDQHRGRLVDFHGDNFLAEFTSAVHGVECALEIQSVLKARNARLPAERRMQFRIGVHLGEVRPEGERLFGVGVSIAARLQSLAEPGGLCISGKVHDELQNRLALNYEDLGDQHIKNIPDPVRTYRVQIEPQPAADARTRPSRRGILAAAGLLVVLGALAAAWALRPERPTPATTLTPIWSLAVLPLENLSGDPEQEYFAAGMTEALINELGKIGSLLVTSRTSTARYKNSDKTLPEIARELGVEGILEGTVMRAGDRVRIMTQLIDARIDTHLWSDSYERELSEVLTLQSEIARDVVRGLRITLTTVEAAALEVQRKVDPRAYEAYLRGTEFAFREASPNSSRQMLEHYERATELDPSFAEAFAQVAFYRASLGELSRVREAAERALELDGSLAIAHAAVATALLYVDWDLAAAGRAYERAMKRGPNVVDVLARYAQYLVWMGRVDEGLAIAERTSRLLPDGTAWAAGKVLLLTHARRYERALEEIQRVRELQPGHASLDVAFAYWAMDRHQAAHEEFIALWRQSGPSFDDIRTARERGWADGGWEGAQRATAAELIHGDQSPFIIALFYADLGEPDEAFSWLERGYREHDPLMLRMKAARSLDPIRSDPRFDDLLRRIGFPEG